MKGAPHMVRALDCPTPNKRGYETRDEAKKQLRYLTGNGKLAGHRGTKRLRAYRCRCGLFHLGNDFHGNGSSETQRSGCAVRFDDGVACAFPVEHQVTIAGRTVLLCDMHRRDLLARAGKAAA